MTNIKIEINDLKGGIGLHHENKGARIDMVTGDGHVVLHFNKSHDFKFFKRFFQDSHQAIDKFARGLIDVFEKYHAEAKRRVETVEMEKEFYKGKKDAFEIVLHYLKTRLEDE